MKKYLLLCISFCIMLTTMSAPWDINGSSVNHSVYGKSVSKNTFHPDFIWVGVWRSDITGNLIIPFNLVDYTDNREWKATIAVRTYTKVGWSFQWITIFYNIIVPPNTINWSGEFVIPSYNQYEGYDSNSGVFSVNADQYYVSSWVPL